MVNLDNLFVGAIQAGVNGFVMYWAVRLATRLEKIRPDKKDKTEDKKDGDNKRDNNGKQIL